MRIRMRTILTILTLLVIAGPLFAHTLYLKDGRIIKGKILAQTAREIRIDVNGTVLTFQKTDVRQVDFDQGPQVVPVKPQKPTDKPADKPASQLSLNRWTVAGRSALIPGWGHYAMGERWKGAGYLTATVLATGYALSRRSASLEARKTYESQNTLINVAIWTMPAGTTDVGTQLITSMLVGNSTYNPYQAEVDKFNNSMRILGIVYGLQLVHAYFSGRAYEQQSQGSAVMPVQDGANGQALAFLHYWTF